MTDGVFHEQKGKNLVTYVYDIVVKSDKKETHIEVLQEIFANLHECPEAQSRQVYLRHL